MPISQMTVDEAREYLAQGQFPTGSMGPKIEAAIEYIQNGGEKVLITSASHLKASLINRSGTKIIPSH
jgi:carbamate kinase